MSWILGLKTIIIDIFTFPQLGIGTFRVWQRDYFYFRKYLLSSFLWSFSEPLLYIAAFGYGLGFFVGNIGGIPYLDFFAPAVLATTVTQGAVFESTYSSFTKMRVQKTFETIMMTPVGVQDVVAGEIIWGASKAFFGVIAIVVVYLVMGMINSAQFWYSLPILFILGWCMSALAMVVTGYARDYDSFTYFFSLIITPMSLLAGTFFPLDHFPKWGQVLAMCFPLTHGVAVTRALYLGKWEHQYWIHVGGLLLLSIIFTNWAIAVVRRRLIY